MKILLTDSGNIFARGIRWFCRGNWSHAAMLFSDGTVIEAVWPKVRKIPFAEWLEGKGTQFKIFTVETSEAQTAGIRAYAEAQIGKPYSLSGDLRFVTRQNYESQPDDDWFCSEYDFECFYEGAAIALFARTRGWQVWPDMLQRSVLVKDG